MVAPKRAQGASALMRAGFEKTTTPGVPPAPSPTDTWYEWNAFSHGLSAEQPLEVEPLLGSGRDAQDPSLGAFDVTGDNELPIDQSQIGIWLKLMLGDAVNYVGNDAPQVGARGFVQFTQNPLDQDKVVLDGQTWTFVTAGPAPNETLIGATLGDTLDQLVIDLEASIDPNIAAATYSRLGSRLMIQHDTADSSGDAFTLSSSNAVTIKPSNTTLRGGGAYHHVFHSGSNALPSMTTEIEYSDLPGGSERFRQRTQIRGGQMTIPFERSGQARGTISLIAQDQIEASASIAGTPTVLTKRLFSNFQGVLQIDGELVANVTAAEMSVNNNLDPVGTIRGDGKIEDADAGLTEIGVSYTARLSENALKALAGTQVPAEGRFGYYDRENAAELSFTFHRVLLPIPREEISGPGGIEVPYQGQASTDQTVGRSTTVDLYNSVIRY